MFVLTISEKIKETRITFSQGSVTVLQKMANYQDARVELTSTQWSKLKLNKEYFHEKELIHESFLTTRKTTKIRNAFTNNMLANLVRFKYLK